MSFRSSAPQAGPRLDPIASGGVVVNSGDFIVADEIGVTVIPSEQAEREQKTREWVAKGKTIEDLLKAFGRIRRRIIPT